MLKIRLQRFGRKNQPTFRLVLVDSHRSTNSGSFIEVLGSYDPRTRQTTLTKDRILEWIGKGAQTSDTVHNFLIKEGVTTGSKIDVASKKNVKTAEQVEEEKSAAAKADSDKKATEEVKAETPVAEGVDDAPATEETPAEETKEETPAEEKAAEAPAEESVEEEKPTDSESSDKKD